MMTLIWLNIGITYLGFGFLLGHKMSEKYPSDGVPPTTRKIMCLLAWPIAGLIAVFSTGDNEK
jgi:hypothetical protein